MTASSELKKYHVVDVLGNVKGRDQPILTLDKALELVEMLDIEKFLANDIVFLDPFCKAGEILLALAFTSCRTQHNNRKLLDVKEISHEIFFSDRYFALAPDERHHRLSLRTFLGNTYSHDTKYNRIIRNGDYLSEIDGKLNHEKFIEELDAMIKYIKQRAGDKTIIAVGNPPYHEADGGYGESSRQIYQLFVKALINNHDISEFVLVIPSRWFAAGKGLDNFRAEMLACKNLRALKHFSESRDVFPEVFVSGGICFFHYDKTYQGKPSFIDNEESVVLDLHGFDIIPDDPQSLTIVRKIKDRWRGEWVSDVAWSRKPFGIATDWFKKNNPTTYQMHKDAVPCLYQGKKMGYVLKSDIKKNAGKIDLYKVVIPGAYGAKRTLPTNNILLLESGYITTETYSVIDTFTIKQDAESMINYLRTDFARYLLGLRKITQHIPRDRWAWVPLLENLSDMDEEKIFRMFSLTDEEIAHIHKKVREWS